MTSTAAAPASNVPHDVVGVLVVLLSPTTEQDRRGYDELQKLRRRHDQAFGRWLPHITLVPPFTLAASTNDGRPLAEEKLSTIATAAEQVCLRHASHTLLLDQVSTFPLRSYTNVHLRPYPTNFQDKGTRTAASETSTTHCSECIVILQRELDEAVGLLLREGTSKASRKTIFKPHVSVGQSTSPKATWQLCTNAEKVLQLNGGPGLLCTIDRIQLMTKPKGDKGPHQIHTELPLASASHS